MVIKRPFDLLIVGEINPDLILSGDIIPAFGQAEKVVQSAILTIGSSSVITACGAAQLGLKVAFIGLCGDDLFGHFMLNEMRQRGIYVDTVQIRANGRTGLSIILLHGQDRAILTYPGLMTELKESDIPDSLLAQARHLHVGSYFLQTGLQPGLPNLFRRAHALGLTVSLDTNYDPTETWKGFSELLAETDVFLPNEAEAKALSSTDQIEKAALKLGSLVKTVAIKLGEAGAIAVQGEQTIKIESIQVKVVDTIGAGDNFNAGFLYGYLNGWPLERSLRLATICGALSTQAAGGTTAQPTLEQALAYLTPAER